MKINSVDCIKEVPLSHDADIYKKVMLTKEDMSDTGFTQLAMTTIQKGQTITKHIHKDMYEVFYVVNGTGILAIDRIEIELKQGMYVKIDPFEEHTFSTDETLTMIYFGVAILNKENKPL